MNRAAIIWIILGLVAIVLLVALTTNRSNDATPTMMEDTPMPVVDQSAVRATAAADLTMLQARIEAGETYESLESEFREIRANLAAAYQNTEGAAAQEWDELSAEFDTFEASARAGTSNVLDALARLIASFSANVRGEATVE